MGTRYQQEAERRYNHRFPSCSRTYVTLAVYSKEIDLDRISTELGVPPTDTQLAGRAMSSIGPTRLAKCNGWFFSSQERSKSRDVRAHIDFVLDAVAPAISALRRLARTTCEVRLYCYWESAAGNGGPILDQRVISRLAQLPAEFHFDIWFQNT